MKNPLKTFEVNTAGRDFVVGDLHGSYSAFLNLLKGINFDKSVDRMFSVGDLVDRGPDSVSCLSLLTEPWFHSVLANHEQMMIDKFNGGWSGAYWYQNGGRWGMEAYNDYKNVFVDQTKDRIPSDTSMRVIEMLKYTEELPFLITVNTKSGKKFHILHAELPIRAGLQITDEVLVDPEKVYALATMQRGDGDAFLWFRNIFGGLYSANLGNKDLVLEHTAWVDTSIFNEKLSHIISGHTILQKPVTFIGQTNIDTGAYSSYWSPVEPYGSGAVAPKPWAQLSCVDLDAWKFYQATDSTFNTVNPFVITAKDISDARARRSSDRV
jgi:serine/threonine protein phosphatase 1